MSWFGRQLKTINVGANTTETTDDKTLSFTYGADGLRGTKTVTTGGNTVKSEYVYANGLLAYEKRGISELFFFYDSYGHLTAIRYYADATKTTYSQFYAITNSMGDVIGFINPDGVTVATYEYDAWGNCTTTLDSSGVDIANLNPIRYRGYYYDTETGLYYLQSRYYDPEIGRFLNIDDLVVLKESPMVLTDKNLFAYCDNNPVTRTDDDGEFWETAFDIVSLGISIVDVAKNPSDPWAWAGLVGDAVDLIPFVTGAGEIVKSIKVAKKAAEAIDTAHDTAKVVDNVSDSVSALNKIDCFGQCFVAGTKVLTEQGLKPIETIKKDDLVWAENPETGQKELKSVVRTFINKSFELVHIFVNGEEIITTPEHPFYVPQKGWVTSIQLRAGDILVLQNSEYVIVEKIQYEILETPVTVYNFEVEDFHTYYVGSCSVLVHNVCVGPFTADQNAVIQLAKDAKRTGLSKADANTLWQWADEYGLSSMSKAYHPPKFDSYLGGTQYHLKINGMHINIF